MLITPLQSFNFKKDCSVGIQKFYLMEINFQVIHYTCSLGKKKRIVNSNQSILKGLKTYLKEFYILN